MRTNDIYYSAFSQLHCGDVFKSRNNEIYMKINLSYAHYEPQFWSSSCFNAVRVNDGYREYFEDTDFVVKLDATLSIGV